MFSSPMGYKLRVMLVHPKRLGGPLADASGRGFHGQLAADVIQGHALSACKLWADGAKGSKGCSAQSASLASVATVATEGHQMGARWMRQAGASSCACCSPWM